MRLPAKVGARLPLGTLARLGPAAHARGSTSGKRARVDRAELGAKVSVAHGDRGGTRRAVVHRIRRLVVVIGDHDHRRLRVDDERRFVLVGAALRGIGETGLEAPVRVVLDGQARTIAHRAVLERHWLEVLGDELLARALRPVPVGRENHGLGSVGHEQVKVGLVDRDGRRASAVVVATVAHVVVVEGDLDDGRLGVDRDGVRPLGQVGVRIGRERAGLRAVAGSVLDDERRPFEQHATAVAGEGERDHARARRGALLVGERRARRARERGKEGVEGDAREVVAHHERDDLVIPREDPAPRLVALVARLVERQRRGLGEAQRAELGSGVVDAKKLRGLAGLAPGQRAGDAVVGEPHVVVSLQRQRARGLARARERPDGLPHVLLTLGRDEVGSHEAHARRRDPLGPRSPKRGGDDGLVGEERDVDGEPRVAHAAAHDDVAAVVVGVLGGGRAVGVRHVKARRDVLRAAVNEDGVRPRGGLGLVERGNVVGERGDEEVVAGVARRDLDVVEGVEPLVREGELRPAALVRVERHRHGLRELSPVHARGRPDRHLKGVLVDARDVALVHPLDADALVGVARQQVLNANANRPLAACEHGAPVGELGHAIGVDRIGKLGVGQARLGGVHAKLELCILPAPIGKGKGVPAVGERAALSEGQHAAPEVPAARHSHKAARRHVSGKRLDPLRALEGSRDGLREGRRTRADPEPMVAQGETDLGASRVEALGHCLGGRALGGLDRKAVPNRSGILRARIHEHGREGPRLDGVDLRECHGGVHARLVRHRDLDVRERVVPSIVELDDVGTVSAGPKLAEVNLDALVALDLVTDERRAH